MAESLTHAYTNAVLVGAARVCAEAVGASSYIFTAGMSEQMAEELAVLEDSIVPLDDEFTEHELPVVTLALGPWSPLLQPGNERLTFNLQGRVWRDRTPLGENTAALYSDRDAIADACIAHSKGYLQIPEIASLVLMGGPGIRAASVPRGERAEGAGARLFLTLPFNLQVKGNRAISAKPA
jgi:hypothetical protein